MLPSHVNLGVPVVAVEPLVPAPARLVQLFPKILAHVPDTVTHVLVAAELIFQHMAVHANAQGTVTVLTMVGPCGPR